MKKKNKQLTANEQFRKIVQNEGVGKALERLNPPSHPESVKQSLKAELEKLDFGTMKVTPETTLYKAMTMEEFDKGYLLNFGLPELAHTFSVELSTKLQREFDCTKPSEKATAHLASHSYCRTLEIQRKINNYLELGSITEIGVKYLAVLSKELDRAERHYFNAIQTLSAMKQPAVNLTVKTNQANFAQNMVTQQKTEYEPK